MTLHEHGKTLQLPGILTCGTPIREAIDKGRPPEDGRGIRSGHYISLERDVVVGDSGILRRCGFLFRWGSFLDLGFCFDKLHIGDGIIRVSD